uniref:Bicarbonate transporter-like transmembrane domain-containing protein n=1 Tax=Romanomermis culicivorax TaxID=13658 RepID=A0A915JAC3_ROMCU
MPHKTERALRKSGKTIKTTTVLRRPGHSSPNEWTMRMRVGPDRWYLGRGLKDDIFRRLPFYITDYFDGVRGPKSIQKLLSTVVFLYFACILPSIAFGVLNHDNTNGSFGVKQAVFAQAFGGIFFAIFGGQPMIILVTTVPVAIYVKIIYIISADLNHNQDNKHFMAMYACVGLWAQFFVIFYAFVELSNIMKFATRSTEEIFSIFMALAFVVESFKALNADFSKYYHSPHCGDTIRSNNGTFVKSPHKNMTMGQRPMLAVDKERCHRETTFHPCSPFLTRAKRELLADFALPVAVIVMSITGTWGFKGVKQDQFHYKHGAIGTLINVSNLPSSHVFLCMGLGFCLSFLFFMDQNITSSIVNNPQNKLKKGVTTHLDLLIVGFLNIALSLYGLPWMYAALPHSPLHLRALADVEERVAQGHVHEVITNVRETRLASLIAHVLILVSALLMLPEPLIYIPRSVLDGLFLYMAVTSVNGNEMFERILLLFTEQAAYPPTHYIRRVPQRKVHLFTVCQLIQLCILCSFGFAPYPYIEMVFPLVCFCFLPVRHLLIPRLIDYKFLDALDGRH